MPNPINKVGTFFLDARQELKKVNWPTLEELRSSTVVVIISIVLLAIFIGVIDLGLSKLIEMVIRH
ncbi:MAG: preprotein translocase subunit SecE [Chlamydiae bacterium]|nr:preprotein translocase subunit SecE [Chlamydiota bacterium]MBI3266648.1 preprotein translocase subunit SecE [Chlamydiota bacterium]